MSLRLVFHPGLTVPVDAAGLLPEKLLELEIPAVRRVRLPVGRERIELGELCGVEDIPDGRQELVLAGQTGALNRIGRAMTCGSLVVDGDADHLVGMEMSGGSITVTGSVGNEPGASMTGGTIRVLGSAGNHAGGRLLGRKYAMSGGEIFILGSAGTETGRELRRGVIVVGGNCGPRAGCQMRAGTILVRGTAGDYPGLGMRRGSLLAGRCGLPAPGFTESRAAELEWLRLLFRYLSRQGIILPQGWAAGCSRRMIGDFTELGRGELYLYENTE